MMMKRKYSILQRNVSELESQIKSIISEGDDDEDANNRCRQRYMDLADGMERKLELLKTHIAAEFSLPHPDNHHLSHLDHRFDKLQSAFVGLKNNLLHHQALADVDLDAPSSCSDVDNEAGEEEFLKTPFKEYANPLYFDECAELEDNDGDKGGLINSGVKEEEEEQVQQQEQGQDQEQEQAHDQVQEEEQGHNQDEDQEEGEEMDGKCWCEWRSMAVGLVAGTVMAVTTMVSLVFSYGVRCSFVHPSVSLFPPPT